MSAQANTAAKTIKLPGPDAAAAIVNFLAFYPDKVDAIEERQ